MRKLTVILTFFMLVAFVLEFSLNVRLSNIQGLSLKNVAIYLLILLLLVGNSLGGRPIIARGPLTAPAIAFVAYCTVSLLLTGAFNLVPGYSVTQELLFFKSAMDPYILLVIFYSLVDDEKTAKTLLLLLVGVYAVFLAITLLGSFNIVSIKRVYINEKLGRTRGAFSEWNQYPLYLAVFIPLLIAYFRQAASRFGKAVFGGLLVVAAYVMLLAGSRGGLVSLAVALGAYYMLESRQQFARKLIGVFGVYAVAILALFAIGYLLPEGSAEGLLGKITGKFFEEHNVKMDYSSGRLGIWEASLTAFIYSPVFGTGWRSFIPLFGGNSHNDFLLYLVTTGVIGFGLFVWVFARMFKAAFRHRRADPRHRHLYHAFIAGLAAYMMGSFLVNIYTPAFFVFMYAALIVRLGYVARVAEAAPVEEERDLPGGRILSRARSAAPMRVG